MNLEELKRKMDEEHYIYDETLSTVLYVALQLGRPLLIEGAAGVGKTEVAKVMAAALDRELVRLQCYEGLDESKALYEWNYQKQLLSIQVNMNAQDREALTRSLFSDEYLLERPLLKSIRSEKPVVLLCDVSGSMVQFSEFALRFIQSLNQVSESSRVFLFSETAVEADAFRLQNMDLFRSYVKDSGIYGRGTDLGEALETLCAMHPSVLGASATLLILSDTKTIDQPRAVAAVREAKRQAGRVIFLNPIPEGKWQYIRSVQTMASICPMVSCSTLRELASACRRLTKEM